MDAKLALTKITSKGWNVMHSIATRQVSFFDEGFEEGSGTWGEVLADETGVRSGVLNGLEKQGLLKSTKTNDGPEYGKWWELTELGAEAVKLLRDKDQEATQEFEEIVEDASKTPFRDRLGVKNQQQNLKDAQKGLTAALYHTDREALKAAIEDVEGELRALRGILT